MELIGEERAAAQQEMISSLRKRGDDFFFYGSCMILRINRDYFLEQR
jgi:hypothetical protein